MNTDGGSIELHLGTRTGKLLATFGRLDGRLAEMDDRPPPRPRAFRPAAQTLFAVMRASRTRTS